MGSGGIRFLLIGAIVTNMVLCDIYDHLIGLRTNMRDTIDAFWEKLTSYNPVTDEDRNSWDTSCAEWVKITVKIADTVGSNFHNRYGHGFPDLAQRPRHFVHAHLGNLRSCLYGNSVAVDIIKALIDALLQLLIDNVQYLTAMERLDGSNKYENALAARAAASTATMIPHPNAIPPRQPSCCCQCL
jgi:hypothetical protein